MSAAIRKVDSMKAMTLGRSLSQDRRRKAKTAVGSAKETTKAAGKAASDAAKKVGN